MSILAAGSPHQQVRRMMTLVLLTVLAPLVASGQTASGQTAKPAAADEQAGQDLPLRRVVMFSSGVAFFEHGGQVEGDATVNLQFRVDDVNDLLKSMVLQDLGGGTISTINFASRDPITRTLKTFAIDLTTNPTLAGLLSQVRGEEVEVNAPTPIVGIILGVEKRDVPGDDGQKTTQADFLNLLTSEGLRSVSLASVSRIKLLNEKLDAELRQALRILAQSHATDKKTVSLNFTGEGKRPVKVGYIQEAPIWKTSYRLVLKDDAAPLMQGWAIVENTTEADWNGVDLSLISGRPISFVMDLYEPLYVPRPVVEPELFASLRPQTYDQSLGDAEREFRQAGSNGVAEKTDVDRLTRGRQLQRATGKAGDAMLAAPARRNSNADDGWGNLSGVKSLAEAGDVGELFQYHIEAPVTLTRQKSAMLPIVNGKVEGKKVSIYNQNVNAKHPLSGLELTNSTGLHLMQGPITVFDDGAYAGDAQIQDLPPGSKRLISYALDLDTEVAPSNGSGKQELVKVALTKGILVVTRKYEQQRNFTVKNSGRRVKTVLVEHPKSSPWHLVTPEKPAETTRDLYRFAVEAKPGEAAKLAVVEQYTADQRITLSNIDDNTILLYVRAKEVDQKVKDALNEVLRRKHEIQNLVNQRNQLEQQIRVVDQEQARIRQNMAQLDRNTDLYNRYVKKFTEQEDQVESLRTQIRAIQAKETQLRKDLDDFLINLTI